MPEFSRQDFHLGGVGALGRASFKPPFKAGEAMINEARFVHVVHGNSRLTVPNASVNLGDSDSFIMKSENFVNQWFPNEDGSRSEVIIIILNPEILRLAYGPDLPEVFRRDNIVNPTPIQVLAHNEMMEHFIGGLRMYFDKPELVNDEVLKLKIRELIELLTHSDKANEITAILSTMFRNNEYQFKEIIEANLFEELSSGDLALLAGMSLSTFKRRFGETYGTSPSRYIQQKRIDRAKFLLETTTFRVSEIAYDCGFKDLTHFSRTFHNLVGSTPTSFRESVALP